MLMPKRVKRRRQFRGRMKGAAHKGTELAYGQYGLVALEPCWIKSNQIEAARVAMTRFIKRGGKVWTYSLTSRLPKSLRKHAWAPVRALPNIGWRW